jgi:hypothetical protein
MMIVGQGPEYDGRLRAALESGDWRKLRDFARAENQIPDDVYGKDEHFWEVLMHKIICNRVDTLSLHANSRAWLERNGYTTDVGGF